MHGDEAQETVLIHRLPGYLLDPQLASARSDLWRPRAGDQQDRKTDPFTAQLRDEFRCRSTIHAQRGAAVLEECQRRDVLRHVVVDQDMYRDADLTISAARGQRP
jgi:hypothetical protein